VNLIQTLSTLGNAGAVANARRGAEVQHRHELAAMDLALRLDRLERPTAVVATRPARAA
jgi:hypothetical protein